MGRIETGLLFDKNTDTMLQLRCKTKLFLVVPIHVTITNIWDRWTTLLRLGIILKLVFFKMFISSQQTVVLRPFATLFYFLWQVYYFWTSYKIKQPLRVRNKRQILTWRAAPIFCCYLHQPTYTLTIFGFSKNNFSVALLLVYLH